MSRYFLPAAALALLIVAGCASTGPQRVDLSQVPSATQVEIGRATSGARNVEIVKRQEDGRVIYDVTFVRDGGPHQASFAEDGGAAKH